jgi:hypothetical protein
MYEISQSSSLGGVPVAPFVADARPIVSVAYLYSFSNTPLSDIISTPTSERLLFRRLLNCITVHVCQRDHLRRRGLFFRAWILIFVRHHVYVVAHSFYRPFHKAIKTGPRFIMAEQNTLLPQRNHYCKRCWSMTTTMRGLQALSSNKGYQVYDLNQLKRLVTRNERPCVLCKWIWDLGIKNSSEYCSFRTNRLQLRWNRSPEGHHNPSRMESLYQSILASSKKTLYSGIPSRFTQPTDQNIPVLQLLQKEPIFSLKILSRDFSLGYEFRVFLSDGRSYLLQGVQKKC